MTSFEPSLVADRSRYRNPSSRDGVAGDAFGGRIQRGPESFFPLAEEDLTAPGFADPPLPVGVATRARLEAALREGGHPDAGDGLHAGPHRLGLQRVESLHAPLEQL